MKLSAQEIADIIQVTRRTVERRANKEGWPYEEIPSPGQTGTKRLYLIERLPNTDIQGAILRSRNPITQHFQILRHELRAAASLIDAVIERIDELERGALL